MEFFKDSQATSTASSRDEEWGVQLHTNGEKMTARKVKSQTDDSKTVDVTHTHT